MRWGAAIGVFAYFLGETLSEILTHIVFKGSSLTWDLSVKAMIVAAPVAVFLLIGSAFLDVFMDIWITEEEKHEGEID